MIVADVELVRVSAPGLTNGDFIVEILNSKCERRGLKNQSAVVPVC